MHSYPMFSFDEAHNRRIGLLGGSFNPIHRGHLYMARQVLSHGLADVVVLLPSGTPPHKHGDAMAAAVHRLRMVSLAVQGVLGMAVSDYEIGGDRPDYTANTLEGIGRLCGPGCALSFIMGADSLMDLEKWRDPERILSQASILAVYRPGQPMEALAAKADCLREKFDARITLIGCRGVDVSSSMIRDRVRKGEPIDDLTPGPVAEYIRENRLYGE